MGTSGKLWRPTVSSLSPLHQPEAIASNASTSISGSAPQLRTSLAHSKNVFWAKKWIFAQEKYCFLDTKWKQHYRGSEIVFPLPGIFSERVKVKWDAPSWPADISLLYNMWMTAWCTKQREADVTSHCVAGGFSQHHALNLSRSLVLITWEKRGEQKCSNNIIHNVFIAKHNWQRLWSKP